MRKSDDTEYISLTGNYADAYADVLQKGGQLYAGMGKDSANVVVRGRTVFTYWPKDSPKRTQVRELSRFFNIEEEDKTGGRLARWLLNDALKLPYQETFWNRKYHKLAKNGQHWHYYHITPGRYCYGVEFDIKSAYISSLFAGRTLLYQEGRGYLDDNGTLESLKGLCSDLPKWFRLQLLGILASWKMSFLCRDKKNPSNPLLVYKTFHKVAYGAAFNAAHRAILRTYKIMQKVHQIGGEYINRIHTDSFFLSIECPPIVEEQIFNYLEDKGLITSVKGSGKAYFLDLNTGFIGKKFVGAKQDVVELMRENNLKMQRTNLPPRVVDRFGRHLSLDLEGKLEGTNEEISPDIQKQLDLFDN
jgi:hypothetical protein